MIFKQKDLFRNAVPVLVIVGTYIWAVTRVASYRQAQDPPGTIVIRLAHWQLESGVRDGIDQMAREYRKTHPKVRIVQEAVPEGTYGQWVGAQLMGGTAPDLMELGGGLPRNMWLAYYNRYFIPLTQSINGLNPYNRNTSLAKIPLRLTYKDGMRASYIDELQEYMGVPLSQFGVRIFYNRDLLKRLTGLDQPPTDYRQFLATCEAIRCHRDPAGRPYVPIAGSKYHLPMWELRLINLVTYPALAKIDFNRSNSLGVDEMFVGIKTGQISLQFPAYRARFQMLREVTQYFPTGWPGLGRDEAVFLFAQQRAVFISTGTWDAMSLRQQAEGRFRVAVMDFPLPTKDDRDYGKFVEGRLYENPAAAFQFGVTRTSAHPEVAMDFLLFMAGQKNNEELNRRIGWIPAIKGARLDPFLAAFQPHMDGIYPGWSQDIFNLGGETWIKWLQCYSLYQIGRISIDDFINEFEPFYKRYGLKDFKEQQRDWRRGVVRNEQLLAASRVRAMNSPCNRAPLEWIRYVYFTENRQVFSEVGHNQQMLMVEKGVGLRPYGPYEHRPGVLDKVKRRIVGDHGGTAWRN